MTSLLSLKPPVLRVITGISLCLILSGCSLFSASAIPKMLNPMTLISKDSEDQVVEIMALWQPGEGRDVEGMPSRGFAGQLFFFAQGNKVPVEVPGDVKVYVFDDQGTPEEQAKPIHIYQFSKGAWDSYFAPNNIGPAYQVFIPYPKEHSYEARCTLRVKYIDSFGRELLSDSADVILSGKKRDSVTSDQKTEVQIQTVNYEEQQQPEEHTLTSDRIAVQSPVENQTEKRLARLEQLLLQAIENQSSQQPEISQWSHPQQSPTEPGSVNQLMKTGNHPLARQASDSQSVDQQHDQPAASRHLHPLAKQQPREQERSHSEQKSSLKILTVPLP